MERFGQPGALEGFPGVYPEVVIDGEAPGQPRFTAAVAHIGHESRRAVAPSGENRRKRHRLPFERRIPTGLELVPMAAGEYRCVAGKGPRSFRMRLLEYDDARGPAG